MNFHRHVPPLLRVPLLLILAAGGFSGCGYYTYLAPTPHETPAGTAALPMRLAVRTEKSPEAARALSRAFMGKPDDTVGSFIVEYFTVSGAFASVDQNLPGDADLVVQVERFEPRIRDSYGLRSQENEIQVEVFVRYRLSSPRLTTPVEGQASGFGQASSPEPLTVRHHQTAMTQALQSICDSLYGDIVPTLQRAGATPPRPSDDGGWKEITPVPQERP